jgi:hypothetical protein
VKSQSIRALLVIPALLLSACGGGGGGGGSAVPPATPLAISTTNSKAVSADALDNSTDTTTAQTGTALVTGVQVDGGSTTGARRLVNVGRALLAMAPARPALATGVAMDETAACSGGGTLRVVGSVADATGNTLNAGDQITLIASSCSAVVDGQPVSMNGSLAITINSGRFNPNAITYPTRLVMTFVTTNFTVVEGSERTTSNGDLRIDINMIDASSEDITLSGSSLSDSHTTSAGTRSSTLKNYSESLTVRGTSITSTITATVESTNSRLGSGAVSYTISTVTPLAYAESGDVSAGVLKVTGANNSALLLTVTATNTFKVEVDANGDGTYESSTTGVTKAELEALL